MQMGAAASEHAREAGASKAELPDISAKLAALQEQRAAERQASAEADIQAHAERKSALSALQEQLDAANTELGQAKAAWSASQQSLADVSSQLAKASKRQDALCAETEELRASLIASS